MVYCSEESPSSGFPSQRRASLHSSQGLKRMLSAPCKQHLSGQEGLGLTVFIFYRVASKKGNVFSHNSGV